MKIAYISTYPPRECGLATFNQNLISAITSNFNGKPLEETGFVVAINDSDSTEDYSYPGEVKHVLRQQHLGDYNKAADFINTSDADACILQHEFGIYGGESGIYVLPFINQIEKPIITILHTVLKKPSYLQKVIIQELARRSAKLVVMGQCAIGFLTDIYNIPADKISYIEHGVPDLEAPEVNPVKELPLFKNRKVLLTFGLLSRNKGLETVIKALPAIKHKHPDVLYVILGNTHPGVLKSCGEEYREYLMELALELNVHENVAFINKFVSEDDLINYLTATDMYVTPYLNEAQITSGTLSYAVGAGAAVISTPYWHATELLKDNRGHLFNFKDHQNLATIINTLYDHPNKLSTLKANAYEYGLKLRWPVIGRGYIKLLKNAINNPDLSDQILSQIMDPEIMPEFSLDYVKRLTDKTGIIQHAKYGIPNWKEGYCVDDNARALIMALMAYELDQSKDALSLLPSYMSFLHYMQQENGQFRNFLSYSGEYLDEVGSEDAFGRTIWALGYLISHAPNNQSAEFGRELFWNAVPHFNNLTYLRGISNTIIGISYYLKEHASDNEMIQALQSLTAKLMAAYENTHSENWQWFENHLTYDNAILPLALFHSSEITGDEKVLHTALETMKFLEMLTVNTKYLNPVGNNGWYFRDGEMPLNDQQAIETMAMVLMYSQAYKVTGDPQYMKKMFKGYLWFLGENSLRAPLYDHETKGCCDGLQLTGVNRNQGAESTLAYLISHLTVVLAFKNDYNYKHDSSKLETVMLK
ncbi:MAG TPA: glycosyltransferase family 4 protein [Sphingobacteriaceae bacterium]